MSSLSRNSLLLLGAVLCSVVVACAIKGSPQVARHRWWTGLGPVLPHDTFPTDCSLCHVGTEWQTLTDDFSYDHEAETGVPLIGAHKRAQCILCHNDRGPVEVFDAKGCVGCHEDFHSGDLGVRCEQCHTEQAWYDTADMVAMHNRTRFPLTGAHTMVSCQRCHPGALVGNLFPTDPDCVTCHQDDMLATTNPPHVPLGWVVGCNRCHIPTQWTQAEIDVSF